MTEPRRLTISFDAPPLDVVEEMVAVLEKGGVVAAPTETRYGLVARADKDEVVRRVFEIKKRSLSHPIAVFFPSVEIAAHYVQWNPSAQFLAAIYLPGPLTLILPKAPEWKTILSPRGSLGIRISSAPLIRAVTERVRFPLTATSANISGEKEPATVEEVAAALGGTNLDLVIDAGEVAEKPSTVVDCTVSPVRVVREGSITEKEIAAVLKAEIS